MAKDAYYFSHDSNAHTDPKILKLRMALGWEGYGIYWAIIENLRNQETYCICESEFMFLTLSLAIDEAKLKQMLSKCLDVKLLEISDGKVFSPSLLRRMERADEIRNKRKIAGAKGGKAKANAKATLKQNPSIKGKERKEKEIKEDKKSKPKKDPRVLEILDYLNLKTDSKYRVATGLDTRLNEGYTVEDAKRVIDIKCAEWLGTEQEQYLRPMTLFSGKFDAYLNQKEPINKDQQQPEQTIYLS